MVWLHLFKGGKEIVSSVVKWWVEKKIEKKGKKVRRRYSKEENKTVI